MDKNIIILSLLLSGLTPFSALASSHYVDIYAHRGFRAIAPENTLPAYDAALKMGVDVIDMDINMTKDGVLVVTHNLTLNPQTTQDANGNWITKPIPIKNLSLKQLQQYQVGNIKAGSEFQQMYPHHIAMKDVHIPTLEQVIHFVKANAKYPVRYQMEIKTDPTQKELSVSPEVIAKALAMAINQNHISNQAEIQAFEWQALVDIQQLIPGIHTAYLTEPEYDPDNTQAEYKVGNGKIWTSPLLASNYDYDYPKMVKKLGGTFWEPYEQDVTQQQIEHAHQLGIKVVPWGWTEHEHTDFNYTKVNQLIDWGVDGIITDRPDILKGILAVKGLPQHFKHT
ncbi:glycerophosphodiester phosphodiesterase [Shewanella sp. 202IG2-18]|uniref:glycerophosphodiester phosphodiesterase n=1 Tax=Parashewanella hymeniacidonis TaxID=2807618 RepID=UPI0019611A30|nr:glycerophosphodiester phosphodiesterase [Parashewanella hymeniacidonis]MBM7073764.1 glycerophosphodiester phosphodiesterase [Parashewanella hymeniacidonis]